MSDEDFCLEHGRDFMRHDKGLIAYCSKCVAIQVEELERLRKLERDLSEHKQTAEEVAHEAYSMYRRSLMDADNVEQFLPVWWGDLPQHIRDLVTFTVKYVARKAISKEFQS